MNDMQHIRDKYRLPAKRGMAVRSSRGGIVRIGVIAYANRGHVGVRFEGEKRLEYHHPFELDYQDGDKWVIGTVEQKRYDDAWDRWNARGAELAAMTK